MEYVSKNSNIVMRKKCSTCKNHKVKEYNEPCMSCIKLKDPHNFINYVSNKETCESTNRFPILDKNKPYIPFDLIKPHESQALKNHSQSLQRLAERGGLSWIECLCVLEDRKYDYNITNEEAKEKILDIIMRL